ncbi:MAG: NAD-dependent epimerase/dehydratase family protein [Sphingomonas bacterium]|nr:NAD-dependent epimerase/dehydratase family protein [Sphingomonas bacterium]
MRGQSPTSAIETRPDLNGLACVVLGGGGFLGMNICAALSAAGATVRGFGRRPHFISSMPADGWFEAEFNDEAALSAALKDATHVIHLLGGSNPATHNSAPVEELSANVIPTLRMLEACRVEKVRRVIFLSSGGTVYGPGAPVPTPETAPTDPISAYGIGKLAVEKYLGLFHHLHGLDYRILRVSNPFGPFQNPGRGQGFIAQAMKRVMGNHPIEIWGDGTVVRDFIYVSDVASAVVRSVAHAGERRVFNVGSGRGRTLTEVIESIADVVGHEPVVRMKPGRPSDIPANVLDIRLAQEHLLWRPDVAWMDGLQMTYDWLRSQSD